MQIAKSIYYENYQYSFKDEIKKSLRYRCPHHRKGCKAELKIIKETNIYIASKLKHTCKIESKKIEKIVDVTEYMKKIAIKKSKTQLSKTPIQIWHEVNKKINHMHRNTFEVVQKPSKKIICNIIKNARNIIGIEDKYNLIKKDPYKTVSKHDKRNFFKGELIYEIPNKKQKKANKLHRLIV